MSLVTKPTIKGIDVSIQAMQTYLYNQLNKLWNNSAYLGYTAYGRAYRNQDEASSYTPEVFVGIGNDPGQPDYKDSFFDDSVSVVSFFAMGENEKYNAGSSVVPVSVIFMVNIPQLKPTLTSRADEEVRNDVKFLFKGDVYGFKMTGTETGIANVFREYPSWANKVKFRDEHPWHCFKINTNLLYQITNC